MITIADLRRELAAYPGDARVYAYEGERTGLVVVMPRAGQADAQSGFISAPYEWPKHEPREHDPAYKLFHATKKHRPR
jgi:hypothetical protein